MSPDRIDGGRRRLLPLLGALALAAATAGVVAVRHRARSDRLQADTAGRIGRYRRALARPDQATAAEIGDRGR